MMTLPAYCGFFCDRCPVYRAAAGGDKSMKEELAQRYTTAGQPLSAEDIRCQGCRARESQLSVFCQKCFIRSCARQKGLSHCGTCREYPCDYMEKHIPPDSPSRIWLDWYRERLAKPMKKEEFHGV